MNILSRDQQIAAISTLTEACSILATERMTGIHSDTIVRLSVRISDGCAATGALLHCVRTPLLIASHRFGARFYCSATI
jgi:hypothetical protein